MKFTPQLYLRDYEFPINVDEVYNALQIIDHFKNFDWQKEDDKKMEFHEPAYSVFNEETKESISFSLVNSIPLFKVIYNKQSSDIIMKTSAVQKSSIMEFHDCVSIQKGAEILSQFLFEPEVLLDYKLITKKEKSVISSQNLIGWGAYLIIISFLLFIAITMIKDNGFSNEAFIILSLLTIVVFIMLRYKPKKKK